MGEPILPSAQVPVHLDGVAETERVLDAPLVVDGETFIVCCASMGNPHCIIFLDRQQGNRLAGLPLDEVPLSTLGARIERLPCFPAGTNVEFAALLGPNEIAVRVWERGAGATLACGTGACATMVVAALTGRVGQRTRVHLPGGPLDVEWREGATVKMRGPYAWVYDGAWRLA